MSLTTAFPNDASRRQAIGQTAGHDWVAEALLCLPILAITLIIKFSIPLGHKQVHFPLVVLMGTVVAGFLLGRLRLEMTNLRAYLTMITILFITQLIDLPGGATYFSIKSLGLMTVIMSCYAFEMEPGTVRPDIAIRFFRNVILIIAICGIVQFTIQFGTHNTKYIFPIEEDMPKLWVTAGYANEIPLYNGSKLFKSNGIFLLEPSFFSQYCALGVLIEFLTFRKIWRLGILFGGMVCAFSGSGIALLVLAGAIYIVDKRQFTLVFAILIGAVGAYVIVDNLHILHETHLDTLINRVTELSNKEKGSSGFARFIGPFYLLNQFVWAHFSTAFFGLGAGSVSTWIKRASEYSWDPTWAKVILEYGLVGFIAFMALVWRGTFRGVGSIYLKLILLFQFVVLSGPILASSHVWFLTFLVWPRANNEVAVADRDREMAPAVTPAVQTT